MNGRVAKPADRLGICAHARLACADHEAKGGMTTQSRPKLAARARKRIEGRLAYRKRGLDREIFAHAARGRSVTDIALRMEIPVSVVSRVVGGGK